MAMLGCAFAVAGSCRVAAGSACPAAG
jgi:hypothetical protein